MIYSPYQRRIQTFFCLTLLLELHESGTHIPDTLRVESQRDVNILSINLQSERTGNEILHALWGTTRIAQNIQKTILVPQSMNSRHPTSQPSTSQDDFLSISVYDPLAVDLEEAGHR